MYDDYGNEIPPRVDQVRHVTRGLASAGDDFSLAIAIFSFNIDCIHADSLTWCDVAGVW